MDATVFQGGGLYDEHGQVIAAGRIIENWVMFVDVSRNVDGIVYFDPELSDSLKACVMDEYLHNRYVSIDHQNVGQSALFTALKDKAIAARGEV